MLQMSSAQKEGLLAQEESETESFDITWFVIFDCY